MGYDYQVERGQLVRERDGRDFSRTSVGMIVGNCEGFVVGPRVGLLLGLCKEYMMSRRESGQGHSSEHQRGIAPSLTWEGVNEGLRLGPWVGSPLGLVLGG